MLKKEKSEKVTIMEEWQSEIKHEIFTHYEVLGLNEDYCSTELKKAYLKLSTLYHSDKVCCEGDIKVWCIEKFKRISLAYQVLGNAELKKLYTQAVTTSINNNVERRYKTFEKSTVSDLKGKEKEEEERAIKNMTDEQRMNREKKETIVKTKAENRYYFLEKKNKGELIITEKILDKIEKRRLELNDIIKQYKPLRQELEKEIKEYETRIENRKKNSEWKKKK